MWKLIFLLFLLCPCSHLTAQTPIPGQYVIVLKESVAKPVISMGLSPNRTTNRPHKELRDQNLEKLNLFQTRNGIHPSALLFNYTDAIVGFSARLSDAEVVDLRNDPAVAGVYQDHLLKLEQSVHSQIPFLGPTQV